MFMPTLGTVRQVGQAADKTIDVTKGAKAPNMSPLGTGRSGAFNEAKRQSGVPTSQQPCRTPISVGILNLAGFMSTRFLLLVVASE